ncbi:MAG: 30S ribosomal protein S21 [Candidatus Parcubacteria bacterium]|jgi:ribosomal protein S21|nr:30S ribosomal protein S21 [Candidatus Parcubacteria bacterium]
MTELKRKKGETFESLLRRFNKRMLQSGKILQAKKVRFLEKEPNKNLAKKLALRRLKIKAKKEYLKKIGKDLEE